MAFVALCLVNIAAISGAVYCVMHGHPAFGVFVLLAGGMSTANSSKPEAEDE